MLFVLNHEAFVVYLFKFVFYYMYYIINYYKANFISILTFEN